MVDTAEHFIARPGHLLGAYPELRPEPQGRVDEFVAGLAAPVAKNRRNRQSHAKRFLNEVNALGKDLKTMKAGGRVLIVDDDELHLASTGRFFRSRDKVEVELSNNGMPSG